LENRLSKYYKKEKGSIEDTKMNIQAGLRNRAPASKGFNLRYSLVMLAIIAILLLITIYLLTAYLPKFIEVF